MSRLDSRYRGMLDGCCEQSQRVFTYERVKRWDIELGVDWADVHDAGLVSQDGVFVS